MPTYVYACGNGHEVEITHRMGEVVRSWCPECGGQLRRKFTAPNVKWSSFIQPSPAVSRHLANVERSRDEYLQKKEGRK